MRRPQFTLRALLVATLVVAAFFGGMAVQKQLDRPQIVELRECGQTFEVIVTPDGRAWHTFDVDD